MSMKFLAVGRNWGVYDVIFAQGLVRNFQGLTDELRLNKGLPETMVTRSQSNPIYYNPEQICGMQIGGVVIASNRPRLRGVLT